MPKTELTVITKYVKECQLTPPFRKFCRLYAGIRSTNIFL